jgi:hypothetical protein
MAKRNLNDMLGTPEPSHGPDATEQPTDQLEAAAPRSVYQAGKTFDASETMTPRLALAQGLSPEVRDRKAEVGDFLVMGHEPVKSVILVPAGHTKQRRFVEQGQMKARCYSPDGEQGYGNPGIACAECPFSKWSDTGRIGDDGKPINAPPPCSEIESFVAFSVTHGMPVVWPLKGTAAKTARFLKTLSNGLGMGNFAIEVNAETRTGKGRSWVEPVIKIAPEVSRDEAQAYAMVALGAVNSAGALPATTES